MRRVLIVVVMGVPVIMAVEPASEDLGNVEDLVIASGGLASNGAAIGVMALLHAVGVPGIAPLLYLSLVVTFFNSIFFFVMTDGARMIARAAEIVATRVLKLDEDRARRFSNALCALFSMLILLKVLYR